MASERKHTTQIYLIRHAEPVKIRGAATDTSPLSERGKKQAQALAQRLKDVPLDVIYASPFQRAQDTALETAGLKGMEVKIERGLEEVNWQAWPKVGGDFITAKKKAQRISYYEERTRVLQEYQRKALYHLDRIYHENEGKIVAIFIHGNVIRCVLTGVLGASLIGFISLEINQAGLTLIEVGEKGNNKIIFVNDSSHLLGLGK